MTIYSDCLQKKDLQTGINPGVNARRQSILFTTKFIGLIISTYNLVVVRFIFGGHFLKTCPRGKLILKTCPQGRAMPKKMRSNKRFPIESTFTQTQEKFYLKEWKFARKGINYNLNFPKEYLFFKVKNMVGNQSFFAQFIIIKSLLQLPCIASNNQPHIWKPFPNSALYFALLCSSLVQAVTKLR